jgi:hypothetical protein
VKPHEVIARFAQLATEATSDELSPREQAGLSRLELALAVRGRSRRRWATGRWVGAGALATVAAAAVFFVRQQTLTYEVTHGRVSEGGYIVPVSAGAEVRFSDRSELDLEDGTRLRVSHVEARGARLMLEGGLLHVHIRPRPQASWAIDAGPYVVHVTGTEFDLAWKVAEQTLDLALHRGSVTVDGPAANGGIHMLAGQHLIANAATGSLSIVDDDGPTAAASPAAPRSPTAPVPAEAPESAPPSGDSESASMARAARPATSLARPDHATWAARVSRGDFEGVLASAEQRGIERAVADASLGELSALSDAARYTRRTDVAKRALTAERARFPASVPAHDAAFFLGGLAEDDGSGGAPAALDWYETYLHESPTGAYAPQALGRTISLVQQVRGMGNARTRAEEYLQRFPTGPYASVARKLLQMP